MDSQFHLLKSTGTNKTPNGGTYNKYSFQQMEGHLTWNQRAGHLGRLPELRKPRCIQRGILQSLPSWSASAECKGLCAINSQCAETKESTKHQTPIVPLKFILEAPAHLVNHIETMGNPLFVGIYRGILIRGFPRWCEMAFVHP